MSCLVSYHVFPRWLQGSYTLGGTFFRAGRRPSKPTCAVQIAAEEAKRSVEQGRVAVEAAEAERESAAAALSSMSDVAAGEGGEEGPGEEVPGEGGRPHPERDGRMLSSASRLSTREEELCKHQIAELQ